MRCAPHDMHAQHAYALFLPFACNHSPLTPTSPSHIPLHTQIIRLSVQTYGPKWRKIAARLPGRSDDAVRNRWNRVNEEPTLLVGVRGGANSLIAPDFLAGGGEGGGGVAEDGCIGIDAEQPKKRPRVNKRAQAAAALGAVPLPEAMATVAGGGCTSPVDDSDTASQATTAPPLPPLATALSHVDYSAAPDPNSLSWTTQPILANSATIAYAMPLPPSISAQIAKPKPKRSRSNGNGEGGGNAPASNRVVWSHSEDFIILRYVRDHGHDWKTLAEKLTVNARTPHAIRNRYHRLQAMALDTNVEGACGKDLMAESASMLMDSSLLSA